MSRHMETPPSLKAATRRMAVVVTAVAVLCSSALTDIHAQTNITVKKTALARNPSTNFRKGNLPPKLAAKIAENLRNCGWFDTAATGKPEITISGGADGRKAKLQVSRPGAGTSFAVSAPYTARKADAVAKLLVDAILKKLFGVPRLCQSKIAFCAKTAPTVQEIIICGYDGAGVETITRNHAISLAPDWEPNQRRLLYSLHGKSSSTFVEYDTASKRSRRLATYPGLNSAPAVSPDGKYFAAVLSKDGAVDLYVKSLNTRWIKRLTKSKAVEASPCWSPSGAKICFVSNTSGKPRLYVIPLAGGRAAKLASLGTEAVAPDWSAKNEIVYSAKMGRNYALVVIDMNGGKPPRIVISAAGDWESPSWAPDSRHVVAARTLNGKTGIYVIDTWTGKARRIVSGKVPLSMPTW